jgi:predicted nucleic acid-binding protein
MLLDTCIMIDVLRGKEAAVAFVAGLEATPALSAVTVMELIRRVQKQQGTPPDRPPAFALRR